MSQKITVTHACDLCGAESEVAGMVRLFGAPADARSSNRPVAEVCPDCQKRPITDVAEYLAHAEPTSSVVTVIIKESA